MIVIREICPDEHTAPLLLRTLTLPFDRRRQARQRVRLDDGEEGALLLPRGTVLHDGMVLRAEDGRLVLARAAPETVSEARTPDATLLLRAAYHLGNRHVPVQIEPGRLTYQHDHVLDDLMRRLGLAVSCAEKAFEPEPGAYHGAGSAGHDHGDVHHPHHHGHVR